MRQLVERCREEASDPFEKMIIPKMACDTEIGTRRTIRLLPIHHLVIQCKLGLTTKESFAHSNGRIWQCPNPLTNCGIVEATRITERGGLIECPHCGIKASIALNAPMGKKNRWMCLYQPGDTILNYIESSLQDGNSWNKTTKDFGFRSGGFDKFIKSKSKRVQKFEEKRTAYRKIIEIAIAHEPDIGRKQIQKTEPACYFWLNNNDREWFHSKIPKKGLKRKRK
jgi:hypothetical protein